MNKQLHHSICFLYMTVMVTYPNGESYDLFGTPAASLDDLAAGVYEMEEAGAYGEDVTRCLIAEINGERAAAGGVA